MSPFFFSETTGSLLPVVLDCPDLKLSDGFPTGLDHIFILHIEGASCFDLKEVRIHYK